MKLHIVHDKAGKILAAVQLTRANVHGPRPVAGKGQKQLVVEVPVEHRGRSFLEICQGFRVDARGKALVAPRTRAAKKRR